MSNQGFFSHAFSYPISKILFVALVISLTIFAFSYLITPQYCSESKALISLKDKNLDSYRVSETSNRNALILVKLVETKDFLREVLNKTGVEFSEKDLYNGYSKKISASSEKDSSIIELKTCASTASLAQKLNQKSLEILQIKANSLLKDTSMEIIDPSSLPLRPIFPKPFLQAIIAFFFVFILGVLYYVNIE